MMEITFMILLVLVVTLVLRLAAGGMDHGRVEDYVRSRGRRLLDAHY